MPRRLRGPVSRYVHRVRWSVKNASTADLIHTAVCDPVTDSRMFSSPGAHKQGPSYLVIFEIDA